MPQVAIFFSQEHVIVTRVLLREVEVYMMHLRETPSANYKTTEVVFSNLDRPKQQEKEEALRKGPSASKPNRLTYERRNTSTQKLPTKAMKL